MNTNLTSKPPFFLSFRHGKCIVLSEFLSEFLGYIVAGNKIINGQHTYTGSAVFKLQCLKPRLRKEYSWIAGLCFYCKIFSCMFVGK